jgi:hypothetical protein
MQRDAGELHDRAAAEIPALDPQELADGGHTVRSFLERDLGRQRQHDAAHVGDGLDRGPARGILKKAGRSEPGQLDGRA